MNEPSRGEVLWGLIRASYLVRYSVLTLLGPMLLLTWIGATQRFLPLANVFLVDSSWRLLTLSWICTLAVSISLAATRVTWLNAPDRFPDVAERFRPRRRFSTLKAFLWFLCWVPLIISLPAVCYYRTDLANEIILDWDGQTPLPTTLGRGIGIITLGILAAVLTIVVFGAIVRIFIGGEALVTELTPFDALTRGIRPPGLLDPFLRGIATLLANYVGRPNGYVRIAHGGKFAYVLAPGHERQTFMLLLSASLYVGIYLHPSLNKPELAPFPVLFYAVLVLLIVGLVLGGTSFLLDFYRLPTLALVIIGWAAIGSTYQADHFYQLLPLDVPSATLAGPPGSETPAVVELQRPTAPTINDVVAIWRQQQAATELTDDLSSATLLPPTADGKRTLAIVCAAGGGIQAAAWTTKVLCGLHERYGSAFTQSVGLVSGVSGGSVGAYYYLLRYPDLLSAPSPDQSQDIQRWIFESTTASGLEAIGWGLAFPDLLRSLAPTSRFSPSDFLDRGLALENVWHRRSLTLHESPTSYFRQQSSSFETLHRLRGPILEGRLPIPIFNATICDNGQRFLFSPIRIPIEPTYTTDADEFGRLYPHSDIRLETAVRLSATFSYVTPVCRPEREGIRLSSRWVADGGYADNDGVVSAISALLQILSTDDARTPLPFDRVLLIRIAAFPESRLIASQVPADLEVPSESQERSAAFRGWAKSTFGPLQILMSVRQSSQHERANLELKLLELSSRAWRQDANRADGGRSMPTNLAEMMDSRAGAALPATSHRTLNRRPVQIATIKFVFDPAITRPGPGEKQVDQPPLSWKMSEREIRKIDEVWDQLAQGTGSQNPLLEKVFFSNPASPNPDLSVEDIFQPARPQP
jgi:hypothetical protein